MNNELEIRRITEEVLKEKNLHNLAEIYKKEHNAFRGTHNELPLHYTKEVLDSFFEGEDQGKKQVHWDRVTSKPDVYPPSSHDHNSLYYLESEVNDLLAAQNEFKELTDTPSSYSGEGGKGIRIKTAEDGLEFYNLVDTDEKVKVGAAGVADYLNENYFERDVSNHIRIKQNTLLTGVDVEKLGGQLGSYYAIATHGHAHGDLTGVTPDQHHDQLHASEHLIGGGDPLSVGIPIDIGISNSEGTATNFARRDHAHNHPQGLGVNKHHSQVHTLGSIPGTYHSVSGLSVDWVLKATGEAAIEWGTCPTPPVGVPSSIGVENLEGSSDDFVRKDHQHNHPQLGVNLHHNQIHALGSVPGTHHSVSGLTVGWVLKATGATTCEWGTVPAPAVGVPIGIGIENLEGSASDYCRRDHQHNHPIDLGVNKHHNQAHALPGIYHSVSGLTVDWVIKATSPTSCAWGSIPAPPTGVPSNIGVENLEGSSDEFVRKDHQHNHPQLGVNLHHNKLHAATHNLAGGDELNHDNLAGFVGAEHLSLPNSMANVINAGHTKALHDALGLSHDSLADVSVDDHHVRDHVATHLVGGGDPLSVGVPVNIAVGNAEGSATNFARRDHVHNHPQLGVNLHHNQIHALGNIPGSYHSVSGLTIDWVLKATSATTVEWGSMPDSPPADHASTHLVGAGDPLSVGVPSNIGTGNLEGSSNEFVRKDHQHNHPVGLGVNSHHNKLHASTHHSGGDDQVNHDSLTGFVAAEHKSLPNTIAQVLSDHTKAIHTTLGLMPYTGGVFTGYVYARDHGTAATDMIVNVCYGTGNPPTANLTTIGTLFVKYTA